MAGANSPKTTLMNPDRCTSGGAVGFRTKDGDLSVVPTSLSGVSANAVKKDSEFQSQSRLEFVEWAYHALWCSHWCSDEGSVGDGPMVCVCETHFVFC